MEVSLQSTLLIVSLTSPSLLRYCTHLTNISFDAIVDLTADSNGVSFYILFNKFARASGKMTDYTIYVKRARYVCIITVLVLGRWLAAEAQSQYCIHTVGCT